MNDTSPKSILPSWRRKRYVSCLAGVSSVSTVSLELDLRTVHTIQGHGIEVTAGFIIGLGHDREFQPHIDFIQEAGMP